MVLPSCTGTPEQRGWKEAKKDGFVLKYLYGIKMKTDPVVVSEIIKRKRKQFTSKSLRSTSRSESLLSCPGTPEQQDSES